MVRVDNGSALNVCPFRTVTCLGYQQKDFDVLGQAIRAYDNTRREVMGILALEFTAGPVLFKEKLYLHPGFLQPAICKAVDSCHRSGPLYFASESQVHTGESFFWRSRRACAGPYPSAIISARWELGVGRIPVRASAGHWENQSRNIYPCLILVKMSLSGKCFDQCATSPDQDSAGVIKESWSQFMSRQLIHLIHHFIHNH